METAVWQPIIQLGFAGVCGILLLILVWMVKAFMTLVRESTKAIVESTETLRSLNHRADDGLKLARGIEAKLLARPCIAKGEEGGG